MALRLAVGEIKEKIYARLRTGESLVLLSCERNERFWCEGELDGVWLCRLAEGTRGFGAKGAERSLAQTRDLDGE